ncbi:MAG: sn-glycerol-3-phosphate ABC transporter ATP-binding protein UgpC [Candidatus Eisenbacteria bacterium]|nr:sn-glycerol-3-phosphate ABC transporter ATP-binding protein UgpC [Candidatus Eisenbacteria bacterium]
MASVKLSGVTKTFPGGVAAVDRVDIDVKDKEFVVLLGPSGCGKSTLLRLIAGLEDVSEGTVYIGDKAVNSLPPKDRDVAMVFQNYALYPHMTVFDNMAFGLKLRKVHKEEIRKRVHNAASILGLEEFLRRKPKALSGGQRQRVALGRAIVRNPQVFLFDEPLSNLDARLRVQMRAEISKLHQRLQATMVYVTHDQIEAMTLGERIAVMRNGSILQFDEPLSLYDNPKNKFVAGFIGSPSMNFVNGVVTAGERVMFVCDSFKLPAPAQLAKTLSAFSGKEVVLGIRPEDVQVVGDGEGTSRVSLSSRIEIVELLGNEQFLHAVLGKVNLIVRMATHRKFSLGEELPISFKEDKIRFFDPLTELAIR